MVRGRAEAMQLALHRIEKLEARLELLSGLRIGASEGEIRIGGVDNQVIRHPYTGHPYIPGSSLKGKVRSLLEWLSGAVKERPLSYQDLDDRTPLVKPILQLFGVGGGDRLTDDVAKRLGIEPRDLTDDRGLVEAIAAKLGFDPTGVLGRATERGVARAGRGRQ
jgi:CRISPR type III-A-associated RAMP protein Csm3